MPTPAVDTLRDVLADRFGCPVELAEPPTSNGDGFDSEIHFVRFRGTSLPRSWGAPLVLRIKPTVDQLDVARSEAEIQNWLADRDFPTPRVLEVFAPGELASTPAQVMERAPGDMMLRSVARRPWTARRRMRELGALHARLHSLDATSFPARDDLLDRRLRLTRNTADALDDGALHGALERIDRLAPRLRDAPGVVCHGDFHPLNVVVSGRDAFVIDWTDAGIGDRHGDVARTILLFDLASIAASNAAERGALALAGPRLGRMYRRAYEAAAPVDAGRIARWTPVHLLHGWSQVVALHAGLFARPGEGEPRTDRVPPTLADELRRRFEAALAAVA